MSDSKVLNFSWKELATLRTDFEELIPDSDFLKTVLDGVTRVGREKGNPIRGNLVACGLREVIGHVLHTLAPDEDVKSCVWFKQSPETNSITRRQRANYIVHAGLPHEFVEQTLKLDVQHDIQFLLDAMNELSRAAHVRPETIVNKGREVREMIHVVLDSLCCLLKTAKSSREQMQYVIADVMRESVFERLISESIEEITELATHTAVVGHEIDKIEVRNMDATRICYVITGNVDVELQYGSDTDVRNDIGVQLDDSFPYRASISSKAAKPLEIRSDDVELVVDNRSFYE